MFNVLFLCTGNSARSILAEALINHSAVGRGRFNAYSAGSSPKGHVHPLALETLALNGLPTDGYHSKSWDAFAKPQAPPIDFIFTLCDEAAAEVCPVWPGHPTTAHWGLPDPAAVDGSEEQQRQAFREAFSTLRRRIEAFANLSCEELGGPALHQRLQGIGRQ